MLLILLMLFLVGLTYMDPPPQNGIAINFGNTSNGAGKTQPKQPVKSAPKTHTPQPTTPTKPVITEKIITQENIEAPVIKKEDIKKEKAKTEDKKTNKKPKKKEEPKPDKTTTDALNALLNGKKNNGKENNSDGNTTQTGNQGDPNGDKNSPNYYGQGAGLDGDGNYQLGGRKPLTKPKNPQECNEAGIVVVSIEVDRSGNVINAVPGVRGTTNNTKCLLDKAKENAIATRFNADENAPSKQIGKIKYRFSLSD